MRFLSKFSYLTLVSICLSIAFAGEAQSQSIRANQLADIARQQWESSNSGQLTLREQLDILKSLDVADKMDKRNTSIRWKGKLRVPADGNYVFEQVNSPSGWSRIQLWLGETLVLDSQSTPRAYRSQLVPLVSGTFVDFRLDFSHNSSSANDFPVAILTWESEVLDKQIIPSVAFSHSDGKTPGLRGEYFADANWARKVLERTDEAIDFIWDRVPMENGFSATRREVVKACLSCITNDAFLVSIDSDDAETYARNYFPQLLSGMTASERIVFIDALTRYPHLLRGLPLADLVLPLQTLDLLHEVKHTQLLLAWAEVNPQTRTVPGSYIRGFGTYVTTNVEPFIRIARVSRQIDFDEALEEACTLPSGECNLTMIHILTSVSKSNGKVMDVFNKIDAVLADEELQGDARMTWLLAKAWAIEVGLSQIVRPGRGLEELREAFASTESGEYRFWALQELVARLITIEMNDEAQGLIDSLKNQFSEPEKQETMANWLAVSEELKSLYQELQQQSRNNSLTNLSTELNRRADRMMNSGDMNAASELKRRASSIARP